MFPRSTQDVSRVLAWCSAHEQPVVPQAGMTGLVGGGCPQGGDIVLSLEKLDAIEEIDPVGRTVTVQAGAILQRVQEGVDKPRPKVLFEPGEVVRVTDGPFNDFSGVVETVNYEKNRLQVAVQILGRSTPVELDFSQVEKG